jgi:hypothetical protein
MTSARSREPIRRDRHGRETTKPMLAAPLATAATQQREATGEKARLFAETSY